MGSLAVCSALRHPVSKGWGVFSAFFPYLAGTLPLHGFLRHPTGKGMGIFSAFLPYLLDCTRPLRHSLSAFKSSPFGHQAGLPYTTAPFSVPDGLASACRTAGGLFLYRMYPQAARVQQKAPFLYRTENRLKVIEF